jgi:cytidylate kinase
MNKKQLQIIGLAGTNGSGKDSAGQLLSTYHNYLFVSVTDLLRAELKIRGLPITRENMRSLSAEWRHKHGLGVLVDRALSQYKAESDRYVGVVVASLRNSGEVDRVHALGGVVLWIDADPDVRYERIQTNAATRGRAGEDKKTYEQFLDEEASEMNRPAGAHDTMLNMADVKKQSDIYIENNKQDISSLRHTIEKALGL